VPQPNVNPSCIMPMTIDSLQYSYEPNSNKLANVLDKVPCDDVLTLPDMIRRDIIYTANQVIITNKTLVQPNVYMELISNNVRVVESLIIPKAANELAHVVAKKLPCPDVKYSAGFSQQNHQYQAY
jgi:hypothetical protein